MLVLLIHVNQMDVVQRQRPMVIVVTVMKDSLERIVKVFSLDFLFTSIISLARLTHTGCASNPCSVGICYQLNQHGSAYVCICPDGTLNLSCNSTSLSLSLSSSSLSTYLSLDTTQSTSTVSMIENQVKSRLGGESSPVLSTCSPTARNVCNGGRCILISEGVYGCHCRAGYTGVYCETS